MGGYPPGVTQASFDRETDRLGPGPKPRPSSATDPKVMDDLRRSLARNARIRAAKEKQRASNVA